MDQRSVSYSERADRESRKVLFIKKGPQLSGCGSGGMGRMYARFLRRQLLGIGGIKKTGE